MAFRVLTRREGSKAACSVHWLACCNQQQSLGLPADKAGFAERAELPSPRESRWVHSPAQLPSSPEPSHVPSSLRTCFLILKVTVCREAGKGTEWGHEVEFREEAASCPGTRPSQQLEILWRAGWLGRARAGEEGRSGRCFSVWSELVVPSATSGDPVKPEASLTGLVRRRI